MYIKSVSLSRFKSYRDLSYMEEFSPQINLVIGENGQGKSNFLDSLLFALTNKYFNLRQEEKKCLLHEDSVADENEKDSSVIKVDVLFSNKGHVLPVDKDPVTISKYYYTNEGKEEFYINKRRIGRADLKTLFDTTGLGKPNPHFIIQQGKINLLIQKTDYDLFDMFSDIAGTKIFEERLEEKTKLKADNDRLIEEIKKQKEEVETYLKVLESQGVELFRYGEMEEQRKEIEAFIISEKLSNGDALCGVFKEAESKMKKDLKDHLALLNENKLEINKILIKIEEKKKTILENREKISKCKEEISNLNQLLKASELHENLKKNDQDNSEDIIRQYQEELSKVQKEKEDSEKQLKILETQTNKLINELAAEKAELNKKKNEGQYFLLSSNEEKQKFIEGKKSNIEFRKRDVDSQIAQATKAIQDMETEKGKSEQTFRDNEEKIKNLNNEVDSLTNELVSEKNKRRGIVNNLKKINLDLNGLDEDIFKISERQTNVEITFPSYDTIRAALRLKEAKELKDRKIYGLLIDLIESDAIAENGVDLVLGNRLYSLVVDTMETAQLILELNGEKGPVINIIPLEFMDDGNEDEEMEDYGNPSNYNKDEVVPFLKYVKLNFEVALRMGLKEEEKKQMEKMIESLFGKCLFVKNIELGIKVAKELKCSCVTKDSQFIQAGGYNMKLGDYNIAKQRQKIYKAWKDIHEDLLFKMNKKEEYLQKKEELSQQDSEIISNQKNKLEEKNKKSSEVEELTNTNHDTQKIINNYNTAIYEKNKVLEDLKIQSEKLNEELRAIDNLQMGNENKIYSEEEKTAFLEEINRMEKIILQKTEDLTAVDKQRIEMENQVNTVLPEKEGDFQRRINELKFEAMKNSSHSFMENIASSRMGADTIKPEIDLYEEEIKKDTEAISKDEAEIEKLREKNITRKDNEEKILKKIQSEEAELKKLSLIIKEKEETKENLLQEQKKLGTVGDKMKKELNDLKEEALKKMADLTLNSSFNINEQEKKLEYTLQPIYNLLKTTSEKMKKFNKVNRFAVEEMQNFKKKKEEIEDEIKEILDATEKIEQVCAELEEEKEKCFDDTFNKIKESFSEFFSKIVPTGTGNLILNKEEKTLAIKVIFNSEQDDVVIHSMSQLSGGQKTAVALALIFALSQTQNPPFYILDEVDAALDPVIRANFAGLVKTLSEKTQFIIITFKPEFLDVANNVYHVQFVNKTSHLYKISVEAGKDVLSTIENQEKNQF